MGRLEVFLRRHGVSEEEVAVQRTTLEFFGSAPSAEGEAIPATAAAAESSGATRLLEEEAAPGHGSSEDEAAGAVVPRPSLIGDLLGKYLISISEKQRIRRPHRVGSCWMLPGRDYRTFEVIGENPPWADQFHAACRLCWKDGSAPMAESESEEPTSSSSNLEEPAAGPAV